MPLASLHAPAADQEVSFLPHLDFGQSHAQPPMEVQASPGEKHEGRAAAFSGANSWSTVCLHVAGSHPPAAAQAAKAEASRGIQGGGGKPQEHPKKSKFCKFSLLLKDLAKAK